MTPFRANHPSASMPASWCSHRPVGFPPTLLARSSGAGACISLIASYRLSVSYTTTAVVAHVVAAARSAKLAASSH